MKYKRILMDIDDTLFDFQAGNRRAVNLLMDELGLASETVFDEYQAINHACWEALERGEMTQAVLHVERFRRFLALKGRSDDPKTVADRFAELLGSQAIPYPFAEELVRTLSERVPVVLLTNGITVIQKHRMTLTPIRNWIAGMVISQEAGVSKPDPRIFELALDGVAPEDALMVGDSIASDVRGANNAGIDVCWYNPKGKPLPEGVHAEYTVSRLEDILPVALQE